MKKKKTIKKIENKRNMRKIIFILILLVFAIVPTKAIIPLKIIPGEEWQYEVDQQIINETAHETIQFVTADGVIPVSVINTTRKTENDYQYQRTIIDIKNETTRTGFNASVSIDLVEDINQILITQNGGFPFFSHETVSGNISYNLEWDNGTYWSVNNSVEIINESILISFGGDISNAYLTGSSEQIVFAQRIKTNDIELNLGRKAIISTEQNIGDPMVNFTISWLDIVVGLSFHNQYLFEMHKTIDRTEYTASYNGVSEYYNYSANLPEPQLYSYDNESKLPILIIQSEPVKIQFSGLSLNQFSKVIETQKRIVEYKLVRKEVIPTTLAIEIITKETSLLLLFPSLIVIIIILRYSNRANKKYRRYVI